MPARGRAPREAAPAALAALQEPGSPVPGAVAGSTRVAPGPGARCAGAAAAAGRAGAGGADGSWRSCRRCRCAACTPRREGIWVRCSWSLSKTNSWSLICEVQKY